MGWELSSGSVLGAALSLAVTTMGAGILTLPSAFADAGVILASFLLVFVAIITVYSVDFIIQAVEKLGLNSYEEITRELLGRKAEELVRWMLLLYNAGSATGYLVVIADLFEPLQPYITYYVPFLLTPKHTLVLFWLVIILPFSCVPRLGALHVTSFLAIFATCLISAMVVFRYFVPGPSSAPIGFNEPVLTATKGAREGGGLPPFRDSGVSWWLGRHPLLALPIIMFSFDCQSLVFQIYANLDDMRRRTMFQVSTISLIVSGTIHGAVGLFGYLTNPLDVKDNVISNYDPNKDRLFAVGYVIYAIPINLAFVLLLFPIRDSIFILWYGFSSASAATHVPRRKDFTRLVNEEERVEEQLSVLESVQPSVPSKVWGGLATLKQTLALPARMLNGRARGEVPSETDEDPVSRVSMTPASNGLAAGGGGASESGQSKAGTVTSNGVYDPQLYERARSEQERLRHRKKMHNDVEVIPLRDHMIVSIALSTSCVAVALFVPGIVSVVAFLGGLCSSTLCFTCPALYRWNLNHRGLSKYDGVGEWAIMATMLVFGVVGGTLGTFVALQVLIGV